MNKHTNKELLLPAIKVQHEFPVNMADDDISDFKDQQVYTTNDVFLKSFGKASVSADSVVYKNGIVLKENLVPTANKNYYQSRYLLKNLLFAKKNVLSGSRYLLVTDSWSAGHFHWLCDVLPKLLCIKGRAKEFKLLLPDTSYTRTIGVPSIQRLGLDFEDIVWMKEKNFYRVRDLYYISNVTISGQMNPGIMKTLQQQFSRQSSARRVYISRSEAKVRKVVNESALTDLLKAYGFEIVHSEKLSLEDQITIYSSCNTLCSIHGAGLTNSLFMPQGTNVIELRKKENGPFNVGYWHLADATGHKYYYYNGTPDSDKPLVGQGCNLTIGIADFEKKLLQRL